jgi:predicted anti-sigma-YlaC factor YlaD
MSNDAHARAQTVIRQGWVEDLTAAESDWLREHLGECDSCAGSAQTVQAAISSVRATAVTADGALVERTRATVQRKAQELREAQERRRMLVVMCLGSFISGGITLPLLWQVFAWLGAEISLTQPAWQAGFVMFVVLPGVLGAIALLRHRPDLAGMRGAGE